MRVKFFTTVVLASLVFFMVQFILFDAFFAKLFFKFVIALIASFRYAPQETSFDNFLYQVLMILTYPIRFLLQASSFDNGSFFHTVVLLAVNSLIWGIGIGILIHTFLKLVRKKKAA